MADLPIKTFLVERLGEYDSAFELRDGTGFRDLFINPLEFIVQPFRDEANDLRTAQSLKRIQELEDPNSFDEEAVDAIVANIYITRDPGNQGAGIAKAFFNVSVEREYATNGAVFTGSNGKTYSNPSPFKISTAEMSSQIEDGLFYFEIPVRADEIGADTSLDSAGLVSLLDDDEVVRVTNELAFTPGGDKETNLELIDRARNSIGVRDLVAGKGYNAILNENFISTMQQTTPIGYGDDEMMRDILFNTHVGGKVDGYIKTNQITIGSQDFVGLLTDSSRQTRTTQNIQLNGLDYTSLANANIDRSNGLDPIVKEIKTSISAVYLSTVDMTLPIDLSTTQHVRIGVDGLFLDIRVAGVVPAATTRNEIVAKINSAFEQKIAFAEGNSLLLRSPTAGLDSSITIDNPTLGVSAILAVFDLAVGTAPHIFLGDGPVTYQEGVHYEVDDAFGKIKRFEGPIVLGPESTGETTISTFIFEDATPSQFIAILEGDIIRITGIGDVRVLEKIDDNTLRTDFEFTSTASGLAYTIYRSAIKSGEVVFVEYWFNPLSIDIGGLVKLDEDGILRGVRPGRENLTIIDTAFLRVTSIELIDPLTREPTGQVLDTSGGYGQGGYGIGTYGVGSGADFTLVVNSPTERFSMFEDSYLVIKAGFQGLSFRVNYEYVPEIAQMHDFVRSDNERGLDGDILIKHYLPAYVSTEIEYSVDESDTSIPDNDALTAIVKSFINTRNSPESLEVSDLIQVIKINVDPFNRFGAFVRPFTLSAVIHNADGLLTSIESDERLTVPTLTPFPKETSRPLSPNISHWIADQVVMTRLT